METTHWLYRGDINDTVKALYDEGKTAYRIYKILTDSGVKISIQTVYRRVWELKGKQVYKGKVIV